MEICAPQMPDGEVEETITLAASPPSTGGETSRFHSTFEECESSLDAITLGDGNRIRGSSPEPKSEYFSAHEPKSEYFSPRVELMMQTEDQFSSVVAHGIAHSKVHWSEVRDRPDLSDDTDCDSDPVNLEYEAEVNRENKQVFKELMSDPQWRNHDWLGPFFRKWPRHWHLGPKIAEGGQAEIYDIWSNEDICVGTLLKVFKRGYRLSDLRRQWPHGILRREVRSFTHWGMTLEDGRFAFVMTKCWGDLRKLIDQAMREHNNKGPPFPYLWDGKLFESRFLMWRIAVHMRSLHGRGILHRDLKASNILLNKFDYYADVLVADFESSIGVMGTTFWRAPEILAAVKNRSAIKFLNKADVYSYGMTCFEVVTGRLPFEGELEICEASYKEVMEGRRPKLPSDLDATLKELIERCWDANPSQRPTFSEICRLLNNGYVFVEY